MIELTIETVGFLQMLYFWILRKRSTLSHMNVYYQNYMHMALETRYYRG